MIEIKTCSNNLKMILIKDENSIEFQNGKHKIVIPSKSCEGVLSVDSSPNIRQEYRQLLGRV